MMQIVDVFVKYSTANDLKGGELPIKNAVNIGVGNGNFPD